MSDFPDPDEEYELMYADELELMRDTNEPNDSNTVKKKSLPAKRSLNFSSPTPNKSPNEPANNDIVSISDSQPLSQSLQPLEEFSTPNNVSNKRTADDLFGDINDIDFDDIELPSKRQKTEEEDDLELINRIIESRKLKQMLSVPSRVKTDLQPAYLSKDNISQDIPKWPFMPVTNSDGERMYVRLESEDSWDKSLDSSDHTQSSLRIAYAKAWEEARKLLEDKQNQRTEQSEAPQPITHLDDNNNLWLEKYRPQSYFDLLSDEPVNRALLHWLHLWDKVFFKKEVKTSEPQQRNSFSKRTGQFQLSNNWKGKKEAEPEIDEDGRPHHKVALLCGPPGVGKTTLAHLLAKISGYRPVELNASDERSLEAFRSALQAATLMRSVLDKDKRPNCLILDEIDGAPLPTVELLVKWCTATVAEGKKKAKTHPLRRPVIAICNDLYATSLRPLRAVALIIHVGSASSERLALRLAKVAAGESVRAPAGILAALAARASGDLRAAVQLLQLLRAGGQVRPLTMKDVENASIGTKDCHKTLMQALQAVFTVNDRNPGEILKTIQAAGEYDRLADGIFETYISSRVDGRLLTACETLSWLRLHDAVSSWTLRTQNYSLYALLPLCAARCHAVLATRAPQRVKFPLQAQEMYRKRQELDSIVQAVYTGCAPSVSLTRAALMLDVLPLLPYLLSPTLRSANVQLCSPAERASLRSCAGAMCDYALQLVPRRQPAGLLALQLEPDLYKIAFFGNEERARPPPAVRQAIAREQQLEIIRRNEEMITKGIDTNTIEEKAKTAKEKKNKEFMEARVPNHLQRLQPKTLEKSTPQVHKDFFGRIVPLSQVHRTDAVPDVISSSSVFYQYREGFNNAVRRNVRTKDLL
ncbi:chromosome transmission fidelity protein 18 homolog [Aphomia sociella]